MNHDIISTIDEALGCGYCGGPLAGRPSDYFCSPRCQARWSAARAEPLDDYVEPDEQPAHYSNQVELHNPETCVACVEGRNHGRRTLPGSLAALLFASGTRSRRRSSPPPRLGIEFDPVPLRQFTERARWNREQLERLSELVSSQIYTAPPGEPPAPDSPNWRALGTPREPISFGFDPATEDGGGSMVAVARRDGADHVEAFFSPGFVVFPPVFGARMRAVAEEVGQAWAAAWHDIEPIIDEAYRVLRPAIEALEAQPPSDPRGRALWLRQNRNTGPAVSSRAPRAINPRGQR